MPSMIRARIYQGSNSVETLLATSLLRDAKKDVASYVSTVREEIRGNNG